MLGIFNYNCIATEARECVSCCARSKRSLVAVHAIASASMVLLGFFSTQWSYEAKKTCVIVGATGLAVDCAFFVRELLCYVPGVSPAIIDIPPVEEIMVDDQTNYAHF